MNAVPDTSAAANAASATPGATPAADAPAALPLLQAGGVRASALTRVLMLLAMLLALGALALAGWLWQDMAQLQKQVARQVADIHLESRESATVARLANEQSKTAAAKTALLDVKMADLTAQRSQVDAVLQSLARAKDENLLVDVDATIQLGRQQAQLTGSIQPLLAALLSAEKRLASASQPQLLALHTAITQDIDQIKRASVSDVPALVGKMDAILRQIDTLPLLSDRAPPLATGVAAPAPQSASQSPVDQAWWQQLWSGLRDTSLSLVRVREIEDRNAALLPPEKGYYLRQTIRLRLLNARMALLARQTEVTKTDLAEVKQLFGQYFDTTAPVVKTTLANLEDVQQNTHSAELPAIGATLNALATAHQAAGKAVP